MPALLIRWIDDPSIAEYDLSSLRVIQSGGQRLRPEVRLRADRALPGCFIQENFGMAEGLIMFVRSSDPPGVRRETCGRPASPGDEVYLMDEDRNVVPDGEPGELIVRGPYTLRGYFRAPEHNGRAFTPDGFYRSGDLLRKMPSGNYVVEGRVKDLINRGGEKISAEEVENLILSHPAVLNVAPKYFPPSLRTDVRGRLREKIMFGSDHPSLPYDRILREWDELGYDQSVMDLVFHANAERVLGL